MLQTPHRYWNSRGYLPHFDCPGQIQAITVHLGDSLPQEVLARMEQELAVLGAPPSGAAPTTTGTSRIIKASGLRQNEEPLETAALPEKPLQQHIEAERRRRIEACLDAGHGACWLRQPEIAAIVQNALLHFDGTRYRLIAWVIMPNHIHFLAKMEEGWPLGRIMDSLKDYTAKAANKLLARSGTFWTREYHDRFIRDENHYHAAIRYIERNPVKARLCAEPHNWPWSSARDRCPPERPS